MTHGVPSAPYLLAERNAALFFPASGIALQTAASLGARLPEVARFLPRMVLYAEADSLEEALAHVRRVVPQTEMLFGVRTTPDGRREVALQLPGLLLVIHQEQLKGR